jgi:hypothetical protein
MKGTTHQEDRTIVNMHAPNFGVPSFIKQTVQVDTVVSLQSQLLRRQRQEECSSRPAKAKKLARPYLKNQVSGWGRAQVEECMST